MKATKRPKPFRGLIAVRRSGVHGRGVFARQDIPRGNRIIEYTGERISWKAAQALPPTDPDDPHHTFFFSLDDGQVVNAAVDGNEARWINHSCAPNCRTDEVKGRVYIYARRKIKAGEELFYDYSLEPADRRTKALEQIFRCDCGSKKCRGTMLEAK
ncbi:MAG: SET domain-containing protein [Chthoniobacterales bacterium]